MSTDKICLTRQKKQKTCKMPNLPIASQTETHQSEVGCVPEAVVDLARLTKGSLLRPEWPKLVPHEWHLRQTGRKFTSSAAES